MATLSFLGRWSSFLAVLALAAAAGSRNARDKKSLLRPVRESLLGEKVASVRGMARSQSTATLSVHMGFKKTAEPFDMDPATFMVTLRNINSDILLLFYSATCPDCEKLMPQWTKVAAEFESRNDLTLLSVSDPEGLATGLYHHAENPAVFYIPRDRRDSPVSFSPSELHTFIDPDETPQTDAAIYNKIVGFAEDNLRDGAAPQPGAATQASTPKKPVVAPKVATTTTAAPAAISDPSEEAKVNARFLATLKNREKEPFESQMQVLAWKTFEPLPVARFLSNFESDGKHKFGKDPLINIAAKALDGEPLARKFAQQYTAWYLSVSGEEFANKDAFDKRMAEVEASVLPSYLMNVYDETQGSH